MNDMTRDLTQEIEKDLGVKLPKTTEFALAATQPKKPTHTMQIDKVIEELQMTIRILEEAKKRL